MSIIRSFMARHQTFRSFQGLNDFGLTSENTLIQYLTPEVSDFSKQFTPRQVYHAHFTFVRPESVPRPYFIAASRYCADTIGLNSSEFDNPLFSEIFSGNKLAPGLDTPYCTVYGCHCYGQWFGQLGDGRAMGLGEVKGVDGTHRYELQLKGCGRSPYSRGFDGRAVLRSCIREFLVSEAMHHLGIPTTRALSIIGTGMTIRRPWYDVNIPALTNDENHGNNGGSKLAASTNIDTFSDDDVKYPPNVMVAEPGAVMCRVSRSFLRVAQFELFAKRGEFAELQQLADYVCFREFPHLLKYTSSMTSGVTDIADDASTVHDITTGNVERYVEMFKEILQRNAVLVAEWLRVGYVQGNMNSDNTMLAGRTIDYGPYGWLEVFDPTYQPFTSDHDGKFSFINQPTAMHVNMIVLGKSFEALLEYVCNEDVALKVKSTDIIQQLAKTEYQRQFITAFNEVRRKKLGFAYYMEADNELWSQLEQLLYKSKCDYTIFFRELISAVDLSPTDTAGAIEVIQVSFQQPTLISTSLRNDWMTWFALYLTRLQKNNDAGIAKTIMTQVNPKFVLRNWMAVVAYERAKKEDYSVLNELQELLSHPYDEQTEELSNRWYTKTPSWAENLPGSSFMS